MIKEKRRKQRLLKKVLIGILIFLILLAIAFLLVINLFVVKNVKVEGNELYEEQLITETVLNDEYSWNSLYVLLKYTFIDTKKVPFIDEMEVRLADPQTLVIKVYEKGMMGYLYIDTIGENAYFDKDGFVVETSTRIIEKVPKVDGIICDEVVLYEKLPINNKSLREMLTLTQALKREGLDPDGIHFGLEESPVLYYGSTEVWLGSIELLTQKVTRLKEILPSLNGIPGALHMESWTEESANIIFEKAPEIPEEVPEGEGESLDDEVEAPVEEETPQDDEETVEN